MATSRAAAAAAEGSASPPEQGGGLHPADQVRISGLSGRPELNGLTGRLTEWVPEKQRWGVEVLTTFHGDGDGGALVETVALKLANIERMPDLRVSDADEDYSTLQDAVDASAFGARIVVGDVTGDLQDAVIDKAVTVDLMVLGRRNVTQLGTLKVCCDVGMTRLRCLTITKGIELQKGSSTQLFKCVVTGGSGTGGSGILISGANALLTECVVRNCTDGILCQSGTLEVDGCTIEQCTDDGIFSNPSFVVRDTQIRNVGRHGIKCRGGEIREGGGNRIQASEWDDVSGYGAFGGGGGSWGGFFGGGGGGIRGGSAGCGGGARAGAGASNFGGGGGGGRGEGARRRGDRRCEGCGIQSAGCKLCKGCREVYFCSEGCQITNWPAHKMACKEAKKKAAAASGAQGGDSGGSKKKNKKNKNKNKNKNSSSGGGGGGGMWGGATSAEPTRAYHALIDACRLMVEDLYVMEGEIIGAYDEAEGGSGSAMCTFKDFLKRAAKRGMLPKWWSDAHTAAVRRVADDDLSGFCVRHAVETHDIVEQWGTNEMLWTLRAFHQAVGYATCGDESDEYDYEEGMDALVVSGLGPCGGGEDDFYAAGLLKYLREEGWAIRELIIRDGQTNFDKAAHLLRADLERRACILVGLGSGGDDADCLSNPHWKVALKLYVEEEGGVFIMQGEGKAVETVAGWFDLGWHFASDCYRRNDFIFNQAWGEANSDWYDGPEVRCNVKAVMLSGVAEEDKVFSVAEGCPVAFASCGAGRVGFVGDVNAEQTTLEIIAALGAYDAYYDDDGDDDDYDRPS